MSRKTYLEIARLRQLIKGDRVPTFQIRVTRACFSHLMTPPSPASPLPRFRGTSPPSRRHRIGSARPRSPPPTSPLRGPSLLPDSTPPVVRYSNTPAHTIDLSTLTPSRFLLQREKQLPYRDAHGRVNLPLVQQSLEAARAGDLPAHADDIAIIAKLEKWARHAERALSSPGQQSPDQPGRAPSLTSDTHSLGASQPKGNRSSRLENANQENLPLSLRKPRRACVDALANEQRSPIKRPRSDSDDCSSHPDGKRLLLRPPLSPISKCDVEKEHAPHLSSQSSSSSEDNVYTVESILEESDRGFLIRW